MSCVLPDCGVKCDEHEALDAPELACLCADLASGLHAMAQPLTVLRGALGAWRLREATNAASQRYLEMSSMQVERMSDLLGCLQDILDTATAVPLREVFEPGALLDQVLDGMNSTLRDWGGRIVRDHSVEPIWIRGDVKQLERALRAVVRMAISVSSPGGAFQMRTRLCDGRFEFVVDTVTGSGRDFNSTERLNLGLVESNIQSQGGYCACVENPFCMTITLPVDQQVEVNTPLGIDTMRLQSAV